MVLFQSDALCDYQRYLFQHPAPADGDGAGAGGHTVQSGAGGADFDKIHVGHSGGGFYHSDSADSDYRRFHYAESGGYRPLYCPDL